MNPSYIFFLKKRKHLCLTLHANNPSSQSFPSFFFFSSRSMKTTACAKEKLGGCLCLWLVSPLPHPFPILYFFPLNQILKSPFFLHWGEGASHIACVTLLKTTYNSSLKNTFFIDIFFLDLQMPWCTF